MGKIIKFNDFDVGESLVIITDAGIYSGKFAEYITLNNDSALLITDCKYISNSTHNTELLLHLESTAILFHKIVSLTIGKLNS